MMDMDTHTRIIPTNGHQIEDCALQLYKYNGPDTDSYGIYLELESTIDEQMEHFEGFNLNRKNSIILRTKLSVRVHSIIGKIFTFQFAH